MPIIIVLPITRKKVNLTQEQLAQLSERSQQLIGKLEQGKAKGIGFDTLNQLSKIVGGDINNVIAYVSDDPQQLDKDLYRLAKKLNCKIVEILACLPSDLKVSYERKILFR